MIQIQELAHFLNADPEILITDLDKKVAGGKKKLSPQTRVTHKVIRHYYMRSSLGFRPRVLTIAALKGGIGKTFLSTNVAVRASMFGAKVLLVDLDAEACATNSLLTEEQIEKINRMTIYDILKENRPLSDGITSTKYEGLDILPSSLRVSKAEKLVSGQNPKNILKKLVEGLNYDFIFFELPPSFSTISGAAYLAADLVLIPCTPNIYALESVDLTIEAIKEISQEFEKPDVSYNVILNMFNPNRNASQDTLNVLRDDHSDILLPFSIKESADIQNAINAGLSIFESKCPRSIRNSMDKLVKYLCPVEKGLQTSAYKQRAKADLSNKREISSSTPSPMP